MVEIRITHQCDQECDGSVSEVIARAAAAASAAPAPARRVFIPASAGRIIPVAGLVSSAPSAASPAAAARGTSVVAAALVPVVVPAAVAPVVLVLIPEPVAPEVVVARVPWGIAPAAALAAPDASARSDAPPARVSAEVAGQASRDDGDPRGVRVGAKSPGARKMSALAKACMVFTRVGQ